MKKTICALLLCLLFCAPLSARAFETPIQDAKGIAVLEKLGAFFKPVADQFGCGNLAWANVTNEGKLGTLEFVPPGDKVEEWKRMVTITVYSLEGDALQQKTAMFTTVDTLDKQFSTNGKIISKSYYKNNADEVSAYFEYETGLGSAHEHNAGIFMRVTPTLAAFMQVQARGGQLSKEDLLTIHKLVNPKAKHEEEKKK